MINNLSITDMYMSVLISLSVDEKLDLISKLTDSIRNNKRTETIESVDRLIVTKEIGEMNFHLKNMPIFYENHILSIGL